MTRAFAAWCAALSALACAFAAQAATTVDNAVLANERDGANWPGYGRTFSEQHFSPLAQIDTGNVARLGLAWSLDLTDVWNVSTAPLAVDGVIYFAAGYSVIHAVDALSGRLLWKYDPEVRGYKMRLAWGSRGMAYWKGKVYAGTQDGRLFAVDAKTGKRVWQVQTTVSGDGRYITGAPRVFNGKVLIGHGGADFAPIRGYVTAYDSETGKQLWRFHTVPGDPARGFENQAMEMAAKTWNGQWWKFGGGGTVWNSMTYDPEFNRVYLGTGNGSPWNQKVRSPGGGDNLFLCSIVALDADTGAYVWHYQTNPGETWDFNSSMDMVLTTQTLAGKPRKLLLHAPKNGFFYVLDRETGKLVSADKIAKVSWAERVDLVSGRPVEAPNARYQNGATTIWPGSFGAHNWQPMSFSPDTGLVYIPMRDVPGYYDDRAIDRKNWSPNPLDAIAVHPSFSSKPGSGDAAPDAGSGYLLAWDPLTRKEAWRQPSPGVTNGGTLATHGGLVLQGLADGRLIADDARSGAVLWQYDMGVGTQAPPITFMAGGKQYVAILAGWAGGPMLLGSLAAQHGWVGREHTPRLLAFALDGKARLPVSPPPSRPTPVDDPKFQIDAARAQRGLLVYVGQGKCNICHGLAAVAGGFAPDLRASPIPLSAAAFDAVVRGGALESRGMPRFDDLSADDLEDLRHYLRSRARETLSAKAASTH